MRVVFASISHVGTVPLLFPAQYVLVKASGSLIFGKSATGFCSLRKYNSTSYQSENSSSHSIDSALTLRVAVTPSDVGVVVPKSGLKTTSIALSCSGYKYSGELMNISAASGFKT